MESAPTIYAKGCNDGQALWRGQDPSLRTDMKCHTALKIETSQMRHRNGLVRGKGQLFRNAVKKQRCRIFPGVIARDRVA